METVEGVCYSQHSGLTAADAAKYAAVTEEYARRALESARELGMLRTDGPLYFANNEIADVQRATREQWPLLFRKFLQRFDPFILFVSLIGRGNTLDQAARKITVIYDINTSPEIVTTTLAGWGEYAGIIESRQGSVILKVDTSALSAEYIRELLEAMEHDIKARIYIATKLGENVFGFLKQDEIDFLVKAIRTHQNSPRNSIDDAGRAFEDYLRRISVEKQVSVTDCKGIAELADRLKGEKLIDQKHLELCKAVNSVRIAAAHSKDRVSNEAWSINPDAAIEVILMALTTIRSIHNYIFASTQLI